MSNALVLPQQLRDDDSVHRHETGELAGHRCALKTAAKRMHDGVVIVSTPLHLPKNRLVVVYALKE